MLNEIKSFLDDLHVTDETVRKLERYAALLLDGNTRHNLVAESTLPQLASRHFLDSAQLMKYIPSGTQTLADMGSGAGFPGLVLSILGVPDVHLIESTGKKAAFLRDVIADLGLNATVHPVRIEAIQNLKVDIVTARALKALPELLSLAKPLLKKDGICLFLKGQKAEDELTESVKRWTFKSETFQSLSDPSGKVIVIQNLGKRK